MGENATYTDDLPPRDVEGRRFQILGDSTCGLAEDFDPSLRRCLDHCISLERCRIRGMRQQEIAHLDHVENALEASPSQHHAISHHVCGKSRPKALFRHDIDISLEWSRKSITRPPRSSNILVGSRSTRKSASLDAESSPRATDPKTRTLVAPRARATARISSRRLRNSVRVAKVTPSDSDHLSGPRCVMSDEPAPAVGLTASGWGDPDHRRWRYRDVVDVCPVLSRPGHDMDQSELPLPDRFTHDADTVGNITLRWRSLRPFALTAPCSDEGPPGLAAALHAYRRADTWLENLTDD